MPTNTKQYNDENILFAEKYVGKMNNKKKHSNTKMNFYTLLKTIKYPFDKIIVRTNKQQLHNNNTYFNAANMFNRESQQSSYFGLGSGLRRKKLSRKNENLSAKDK